MTERTVKVTTLATTDPRLPGLHAILRTRRRRAVRPPAPEIAVPALARRDGDARHHPGGAAGDPVDPRRSAHDRDRGRAADRTSARDLGARGRARLAAHRTLGRNAHVDG